MVEELEQIPPFESNRNKEADLLGRLVYLETFRRAIAAVEHSPAYLCDPRLPQFP